MKNILKNLFLLLLILSQTSFSQTEEQDDLSLDKGSIDSQFEFVFKKSGNFIGTNGLNYEAVKSAHLNKLKSNTLDSLKTTYTKLRSSENTIASQQQEIESLKTQLQNTKNTLDNTNAQKDSISLFGMEMSKGSYNTLLWSIIVALLALAVYFLFRFNSSNSITKKAKRKLEEVEQEFEEHRRIALEREQKVRRQLQDEINKNKDKKSK